MLVLQILLWVILGLLGLMTGLVLIVFILTLLPAKICVNYKNGQLSAILKYLFFKLDLMQKLDGIVPDFGNNTSEKEKPIVSDFAPKPPEQSDAIQVQLPKAKDIENPPKTKDEKPVEKPILAQQASDTIKTAKSAETVRKKTTQVTGNRIIDIGIDKIGELVAVAGTAIKMLAKVICFKGIVVKFAVAAENTDAAVLAMRYGKINAAFYATVAAFRNALNLKFKKIVITPDFTNSITDNYTEFAVDIVGNLFSLIIIAIWAIKRLYKEKMLFPKGFPFFKKKRRKRKKKKNVIQKNPNNGGR